MFNSKTQKFPQLPFHALHHLQTGNFDKSFEQTPGKIFKYKCTYSATVTDTFKRRGWVEADENAHDWNIFFCDMNQLRDIFSMSTKSLDDDQRIGHFRNNFEISRKHFMVKNLKRLKSRIERAFGKEEGKKCLFYPTTFVLPHEHKSFLEEFKSNPGSFWIIKPAAGSQGRGIFIFKSLREYFDWKTKYDANQSNFIAQQTLPHDQQSPYLPKTYQNIVLERLKSATIQYDSVQNALQTEKNSQVQNNSQIERVSTAQNSPQNEKKNDEASKDGLKLMTEGSSDTDNENKINNLEDSEKEKDEKMASNETQESVNPCDSTHSDLNAPPLIVEGNKNDVYVVQKYITNPYLIGGRKFDIRFFVLVTSFVPLRAWVYREGFARFSAEQFSLESLQDIYVHLTNVAIQKTSQDYNPMGSKWSLRSMREYMTARHGIEIVQELMNRIDNIVIRTLQSAHQLIIQDRHSFEIFGFDVLIDENVTPWLLEVNCSPSFTPSSEEDYRLKCALIDDTVSVLDLEGRLTGFEQRVGGFDQIWDDGPVYAAPGECGNADGFDRGKKLNSYLGCINDRAEQLRSIYKNALFYKEAHRVNSVKGTSSEVNIKLMSQGAKVVPKTGNGSENAGDERYRLPAGFNYRPIPEVSPNSIRNGILSKSWSGFPPGSNAHFALLGKSVLNKRNERLASFLQKSAIERLYLSGSYAANPNYII